MCTVNRGRCDMSGRMQGYFSIIVFFLIYCRGHAGIKSNELNDLLAVREPVVEMSRWVRETF